MPADVSKFLQGLGAARAAQLGAAARAVGQFAAHTVGDAQEICPKKTGALKASGTWTDPEVDGEKISLEVGFNTNYAAAVHERLNAHHEAPGQAKYLETAMKADTPQFAPFVAAKVKAATGGETG
jgi:hypothetical protein